MDKNRKAKMKLVLKFCKEILVDVVHNSVGYGESLKMNQEI